MIKGCMAVHLKSIPSDNHQLHFGEDSTLEVDGFPH